MPQSLTATSLGHLKSRVAAAALSNANATTSLDTLTVNHGLNASPTYVYLTPRSVSLAGLSFGPPMAYVRSWNASIILVGLHPSSVAAVAENMLVDVVAEVVHSIVA